ncbi:DUF480 domain-containing protein [Nocardioides sp.]|uniref:DUF480 domain-containing protein n=1 Tax=Nocardioides sp. TaxID=35761 RepID=UPI00286D055E|nr:DUF480 domain-containing protein [Nocardioides sp.]
MADPLVLDPTEQRLLGSLMEKEATVPASYPLSLNSLRTACNQTSSRDPIIDLDEATVERVARELKDRGLVRIVWAATGRRTLKYHQTLAEELSLADDERALVTVLLLRGAQTPGELRTRSERLHAFADKSAVEVVLQRLATRPSPLVRELERRPGQHDNRWIHLLGAVEVDTTPGATAAAPAVDRERVIADGREARDERVRSSYGLVAEGYAAAMADELDDLPFERWLLEHVADLAGPHPVVEVGCGPGHVTAHLADLGVEASGIDLAPEMVAVARRSHPDGTYAVGDLRRLMRPTTSDGWGAVLAWYSLIHLAGSELPDAVAALVRPLRPGGVLVLGLHAGAAVRHLDTWFDQEVALDFVGHEPADVVALVQAAGLTDVEWYVRGPVASRGETTERLYVVGRASGSATQ